MAKTKQIVLTTSVIAMGAWQPNRFVNFEGAQADSGQQVLGVSAYESDTGNVSAVDVLGIALVEAGGIIAKGVSVASGAQGLAVAANAETPAAGVTMDAADAVGDIIRVVLKG